MSTAFLDSVRKSSLIEPERLEATLRELGAELPSDPRKVAEILIREGLLTRFQANQLLQGKSRGFILRDKYKMLDLIGSGGMGRVFLCEHVLLKRLVAVKVLVADKLKDRSLVERFFREARAVAALDHPNIVRIFDVEQDPKAPLMVMEYVDGLNLHSRVTEQGPLDPARAAHAIAQAALGLQHAHENGLVHRDIKPANLLMDRNGVVKILDLGLARFFNDKADNLTAKLDDKAVMGTADYIAPEQAISLSSADIRSDIYSLGASMFFLLTGRPPFDMPTVTQKLLAHQMKEVPSVRELRPNVPVELEAVLKKMMAKDPLARYQVPVDVARDLSPLARDAVYVNTTDMRSATQTLASVNRPITTSMGSPTSTLMVQASLEHLASSSLSAMVPAAPMTSNVTPLPPGSATNLPAPSRPMMPLIVVGLAASVLILGVAIAAYMISRSTPQAVAIAPTTSTVTTATNSTKSPETKAVSLVTASDKPAVGQILAPEDARKYVGSKATVVFTVAATGYARTDTRLFLNSKPDYTALDCFTVVINKEVAERDSQVPWRELSKEYQGKKLQVVGVISVFQDRIQMEIKELSDIQPAN